MRAASSQRVQIKRQSRDQSFALACRHLRDSAAMQNHSADQLHIKVHHVPCHRLIADRETMTSLFQTPRGVFHRSERFRQNLIQPSPLRSEEHTSELQSLAYLVCRLLLE